MTFIIKWTTRLLIVAALGGVVWLAVHRRRVVGRMEDVTEQVDDRLRAVQKKVEDVREGKEEVEDTARHVKKKVF